MQIVIWFHDKYCITQLFPDLQYVLSYVCMIDAIILTDTVSSLVHHLPKAD